MALSKDDLFRDLRHLGLTEGGLLFVHSSLSALGQVAGGAETVIAALLEVVGLTGTLAMPAMPSGVFHRAESPSTSGAISEAFRTWPHVCRSFHPTHSVCARGVLAEWLTADHLASDTACGPQTPLGRLVERDGLILLLGVDLDRLTLLHAAEEAVDAPYLRERSAQYLDENGQVQTKVLQRFPGLHRDFIGLDRMLRERGALTVGQVGRATCRLIRARAAYDLAVEALRADPGVVLCANPHCADCVKQQGQIRRQRLAMEERFCLTGLLDEVVEGPPRCASEPGEYLAHALNTIAGEGIRGLELGAEWTRAVCEEPQIAADAFAQFDLRVRVVTTIAGPGPGFEYALECASAFGDCAVKLRLPEIGLRTAAEQLAHAAEPCAERGLTLLIENAPNTPADTKKNCQALLRQVGEGPVRLAFNPAHFAHAGERPFIQTFSRGPLKHDLAQLYVTDGTFSGGYTLPGRGHGEVKEVISILRCRGFEGALCLKMGHGRGVEAFRQHAAAFWRLLDTM